MEKHIYVVRDSKILGGKPIIIGTRIPAERLVRLIEQGYTPESLQRDFPHVDQGILKGAVKEIANLAVGALNAV